jgi:hypothetical protein
MKPQTNHAGRSIHCPTKIRIKTSKAKLGTWSSAYLSITIDGQPGFFIPLWNHPILKKSVADFH